MGLAAGLKRTVPRLRSGENLEVVAGCAFGRYAGSGRNGSGAEFARHRFAERTGYRRRQRFDAPSAARERPFFRVGERERRGFSVHDRCDRESGFTTDRPKLLKVALEAAVIDPIDIGLRAEMNAFVHQQVNDHRELASDAFARFVRGALLGGAESVRKCRALRFTRSARRLCVHMFSFRHECEGVEGNGLRQPCDARVG